MNFIEGCRADVTGGNGRYLLL